VKKPTRVIDTPASGRRRRDPAGDRLEQRSGVTGLGVVENSGRQALFDDTAFLHHGDRVRDAPDDRQVVRDEQIGHAQLPLQFVQQAKIWACTVTSRGLAGG
jgi:hypothetical protein